MNSKGTNTKESVGPFLTLISLCITRVSLLLGMYDKNDSGESCHERSQTFGR